jgi:prepilin-type N-terminal cleavage/methylation domain-containing protein
MKRRGFALAELLVALVISGIIGVALARLVINQSRFVATQDAVMRARSGARAALNVMLTELRMVTDSGVRAAGIDSITVRVPYVFGIACGYSAGRTVVGLLPADSATFANATVKGMAWRDSVGTWRFVEPSVMTSGAPNGTCWGQTPVIYVITTPGWAGRAVYGTGTAPTIGSAVYFYQTVTYAFAY